jgi:hypothetical protein
MIELVPYESLSYSCCNGEGEIQLLTGEFVAFNLLFSCILKTNIEKIKVYYRFPLEMWYPRTECRKQHYRKEEITGFEFFNSSNLNSCKYYNL